MDPYKVLDVPKDATKEQVRRAYRRKAKKHHPDAGGDRKDFEVIAIAYEVLSDDERRRRFDETGSSEPSKDESLQLLAMIINQIVEATLEMDTHDLVAQLKKKLNEIDTDLNRQIDFMTKKIGLLKKKANRVKRKSKGDNFISMVILQSVPQLETQIAAAKSRLDDVKKAKDLAADYHCEGLEKYSSMYGGSVWTQYGTMGGGFRFGQ